MLDRCLELNMNLIKLLRQEGGDKMARVSNETIKLRKELFTKHSSILKLLKMAGGGLYNIHIEFLLNLSKSTLRSRLSKLEEVGLIACDTVEYRSTTRAITRLTGAGWRMFGINNDLGSSQDERLVLGLLRASVYMCYFKGCEDIEKKDDFFEVIKRYYESSHFRQSVFNDKYYDVNLETFLDRYKRNILIRYYDISDNTKDKFVDVFFIKNNPQAHEVAVFCDFLLGVIEKAFNIRNDNFYHEPFKFKINLYVVSNIKTSYADLNRELNNLTRKYAYFNHKHKNSMYTARRVHFNRIQLRSLNSYTLKINNY